jgi:hypothetical protein
MASVWIRARPTKDGGRRYRVEYRRLTRPRWLLYRIAPDGLTSCRELVAISSSPTR